jgi:hypothetical protein
MWEAFRGRLLKVGLLPMTRAKVHATRFNNSELGVVFYPTFIGFCGLPARKYEPIWRIGGPTLVMLLAIEGVSKLSL